MAVVTDVTESEAAVKKPERSSYTPIDFQGWQESKGLVLSPKFQRRGVWTKPARSYLIDTLLLGMPVPPIYLRVVQNPEGTGTIREVIDGQQRISAVLDYMANKYSLAKNIQTDAVGKKYADLTQAMKDRIAQHSFICEVFYGVEDQDVLRIFARLNTYSVKLNAQELRNGRFFGPFKHVAYTLALEHLQFWRNGRIFSERGIARMSEVELTSELMIVQLDGLQDKKKSIDDFYEDNDESFPKQKTVENRFRAVIDTINDSVADVLPESEFRRPPLFYSLYTAIYHRLYGIPGEELPTPKKNKLSDAEREGLAEALTKLSGLVTLAKEEEDVPKAYDSFVAACLRQTDNIRPRRTRFETIYREAFPE